MILNKLSIKNFKGIKNLTIDFNGKNTNIYGENATGKTTVYDSFLWLLFDKDSSNRKDFNLKTIDKTGKEIHMLEHEVEAVIEFNNREISLRKVLEEKWTKKRGSAEQEFSGHETSYYIDEVPVKKSEYTAKINELIDENIFKLITNPQYFNVILNWKDRREMLLSICGDITDEQVINSRTELSDLTNILNGRSTEDYGKIIKEKIKNLNQDIEKIPVRIDELNHNKENIEKVDYEEIKVKIDVENVLLEKIEKDLTDSATIVEKHNEKLINISNLKSKLSNIERTMLIDNTKILVDSENKLSTLNVQKNGLEIKIDSLDQVIKNTEISIEKCVKDREDLVLKYNQIVKEGFIEPDEDDFKCSTCGQSLPTDDIKNKIEELKNKFKKNQFEQIEKINTEGASIKATRENLETKLEDYKSELQIVKETLENINKSIEQTKIDLENQKHNQEEIDYTKNPEYIKIQSDITILEEEINKPINDVSAELREQKQVIQAKINELNKILANKDVEEKTNARISELEQEERAIAEKIAELEGHRFLIEEFIKAKVDMFEESINAKFKVVRFKLFDTQINGGLNECCETLVNGVPYSDVNNAGKINAGMDIIATLIKQFGVKAPIFIDNAESINDLYNIDTQIIRLVVSRDSNLRVEVL
jgi:DNA repair exonuclease SbcCD ATPase subunit